MSTSSLHPHGVFSAALTPLDAELAPDHARFVEHCRYLLDEGCDGIALLGTTGEANSFSLAERTALLGHGVLRAPYGAHPFSSPGFYLEDRAHIAELVEAGRAFARRGDRGPFERYLDRYVRGPADHVAYLEAVGLRRLLSLGEY